MSLCTHGVQVGGGYECSACVTTVAEPTFEEQVGGHLARLAAERPSAVHQRSDSAVLVDELREEYAQAEADQDRNPTEAGFVEYLSQRIRNEECSGCRGILTRAASEVEGRTGTDLGGNADCWCRSPERPHYRGTAGCIVEHFTPSGGAAALRADVVTSVVEEVAALRRNMARYAHAKEHEEPHAAAASYIAMKLGLDRVEQLVRGEQQ